MKTLAFSLCLGMFLAGEHVQAAGQSMPPLMLKLMPQKSADSRFLEFRATLTRSGVGDLILHLGGCPWKIKLHQKSKLVWEEPGPGTICVAGILNVVVQENQNGTLGFYKVFRVPVKFFKTGPKKLEVFLNGQYTMQGTVQKLDLTSNILIP